MTTSDDDLAALAEYESESKPPCDALNAKTGKQCGLPSRYSVELVHTHRKTSYRSAFLCLRCYEALLNLPYPLRCAQCKKRIGGPEDIVSNPRKL
ncbi:hypothetical protein ACFVUS_12610 [Nocardia sp. NPDC058058]|uniref:hypothetical protein n=1 Tax=Nocardia sp. NPDC058058 TaxID=3346317 RepID=UPI0036DB38A0